MRVLIIEDNWANMELMRYLLSAQGHEAFLAETGEAGALIAENVTPDLVLCDLQLTDTDGEELARRLRRGILPAHVPIIAVTALVMAADRERVLAHREFDGYFPKPIDPKTFVQDLEAALQSPPRTG